MTFADRFFVYLTALIVAVAIDFGRYDSAAAFGLVGIMWAIDPVVRAIHSAHAVNPQLAETAEESANTKA